MREASWCFDDSSTGPFINDGCTFETVTPLRGTASAKADCSQLQSFYWTLNPTRQVLFWAARFKFSDPGIGCGLVQWTDYNGQTVDLRLADSGNIYLAIDDLPKVQNRRVVLPDVEFHLQGEIYFTSFIIVKTKFNNRQLFDLNYGPVTQPSGIILEMRFGSFLGTGSGTMLVDDVVINNTDQFSRKDYGYPGNWTGRIDRPNAAGTFQEWNGSVSDINDASDASLISSDSQGAKVSYSFPSIVVPTGRNVLKAASYLVRARALATPLLRIGIRTDQAVPVNEQLHIFFEGIPSSGTTFQISFNNFLSAAIDSDADVAEIEAVLEAHPDIGGSNVSVSVDTVSGPNGWIVEFIGRLAGEAMPPFEAGGSLGPGVSVQVEVLQKGNENFFHPPVGELWNLIPPYIQPVLEVDFANHQYNSLLKPDTHSIWSRLTLADYQILLEYFDSGLIIPDVGDEPEEIPVPPPAPPPPVPPPPPSPPPPTSQVLLEDFSSLRLNGDGDPLWEPYLGEDPLQTGALESGVYRVDVGASPNGIYLHFYPRNGGYLFSNNAYAQHKIKSGTWDTQANRLRFWVKSSKAITRNSNGSQIIELGTYIRPHSDSDSAHQGDHYYHLMDPSFYADRWMVVEINRHPQHQVGGDSNFNWPDNPSSPGVNYFDGLTRFYFDSQGSGFENSIWRFDSFEFKTVSNEPDTLVSSVTATYTGTKYEVTWAGPKNTAQSYDVRYSTSTMKPSSFLSGDDGGSVSNTGDAYTGVLWQSSTIAETANFYVAIRPAAQSDFTEIYLPRMSGSSPPPPQPPPPVFELPPIGEFDFRLLPGSPALNYGASIAAVTTDIRGRSRDASPSVGAYEGEY